MKKFSMVLGSLLLVAASCSPLSGDPVAVGIVKTANGGLDWQAANVIKDTSEQSLNRSISQLQFGPDGRTVYVSAYDGGMYKTTDAAESWEEVLGQVSLYDFAILPTDSDTIYAGGYLQDRGRLFKTIDGGKSWNDVYSDAGEQNPVRAVAVNPGNQQQVVIGLGKGSVLLSDDAGLSWRLLETFQGRVNQIMWDSSGMYVVIKERGVFRSVDNGNNFEDLTAKIDPAVSVLGFNAFGRSLSDYRRVDVANSGQLLYVSTNNGLYSSRNGGEAWTYVSMPYRQQDAAPFAVEIFPGNDSILYVSSGSVVFKTTDNGFSWSIGDTSTNGLITTILVDQQINSFVFAGVSE